MTSLENELRRNLNESNDSCRLFHGRGECFEGLNHVNIDYFSPTVLITAYSPCDDMLLQELQDKIQEVLGQRVENILLQKRYEKLAPTVVLLGKLEKEKIITEDGLKYHLSLGRNQNLGFFLDMKEVRSFLKTRAKDKKVLNLFSYTGAFSVAAMAGGAKESINFDLSKSSLNTARDNHRLNDLNLKSVKYLPHDILKSFGKIRKLAPFDFIILDPPSDQGSSFKVERDYKKVVRKLDEFLEPDGLAIACLNSPHHSHDYLKELFKEHAPSLDFEGCLERPDSFSESQKDRGLKIQLYRNSHKS